MPLNLRTLRHGWRRLRHLLSGAPSREALLFSFFDARGVGLEIGPSFNPLVPKAAGYRVETLDHLPAAALREKYKNAPHVDVSNIEEVDYVSGGGSILDLIGKPGHYDYIIASNVIEHTPDLLGFVADCEALLNDRGVLVLAVPDKRFAFDCLRPYASTGQVLQAHLEKRQRHPIGKVFDEVAYNCTRDGAIAWGDRDAGPLSFFRPLAEAGALFEALQREDTFLDIHAWQFTPSSFRLIMHDLAEIGKTGLREKSFHDTVGHEFFIAFSRSAPGCPVDRLTLAERTLREHGKIQVRRN